jgi:hypothetical protein
MGRPLRHQKPDAFYLLTNRCADGQFLMRPDPECRRIISGVLAREADKLDVRLVCFAFISNHFHVIAGFPRLNRDVFMGRVTCQISDRLNSWRDRSGPMFPIRYHPEELADDQTLRNSICYVLNNPVKDGLVRTADDWPGVTSMDCHRSGDAFEGRWLDHQRWTKLSRRKTTDHTRDEAMDHHAVELHLPDALAGETDEERRQSLLELVADDRDRLHDEAEQTLGCPPRFAGPTAILNRDPRDRPADSDIDARGRSRRRMYATSEPGGAAALREAHRERTDDYRRAVEAMRNGDDPGFPHGMHPPGRARCVGHADACAARRSETDP